jgi:hypothetical protein
MPRSEDRSVASAPRRSQRATYLCKTKPRQQNTQKEAWNAHNAKGACHDDDDEEQEDDDADEDEDNDDDAGVFPTSRNLAAVALHSDLCAGQCARMQALPQK